MVICLRRKSTRPKIYMKEYYLFVFFYNWFLSINRATSRTLIIKNYLLTKFFLMNYRNIKKKKSSTIIIILNMTKWTYRKRELKLIYILGNRTLRIQCYVTMLYDWYWNQLMILYLIILQIYSILYY